MQQADLEEMRQISSWFQQSGGIQSRYFPNTNDRLIRLCQLVDKLIEEQNGQNN